MVWLLLGSRRVAIPNFSYPSRLSSACFPGSPLAELGQLIYQWLACRRNLLAHGHDCIYRGTPAAMSTPSARRDRLQSKAQPMCAA